MKRIGIYALLVLLTIFGILLGAAWYLHHPAKRSGDLNITGLKETVKVTFDKWGIPHIEANNSHDAFLALGYIQAQDRILQMDMSRRIAQGRVSEVVGDKSVELDRYFKTIGIDRYCRKLVKTLDKSAVHIQTLQAYLDGINEFIKSGRLPLETLILPPLEPFTLYDAYTISAYMTFSFDRGLHDEILRHNAATMVDRSRFIDLFENVGPKKMGNNHRWSMPPQIVEDYMDKVGRLEGSNSMVVAAWKSASGGALLANDTHIKFSNPSVWYEAELITPDLQIYGHFLPAIGIPLLGHSQSHGWGITIFHNDDVDLVQEEAGQRPDQILRDGRTITLQEHTALIKRRGSDTLRFKLYDSDIGPDVRGLLKQTQPVSLRWGFYQQKSDSLKGFYDLMFADTVEKAQQAVRKIESSSLNISYANKNGDIGWWTSGRIKNSIDSINEFIPKSAHPGKINPARGYINSTNNRHTPSSLGQFSHPQREKRLDFLMQRNSKISLNDLKSFQGDNKIDYHYPHVLALGRALSLSESSHQHFLSREAFKMIERWDGNHDLENPAPSIFYQYLYELITAILEDDLGGELTKDYMESENDLKFAKRILRLPQSKLWDNIQTNHVETREEIIQVAWRNTLQYLESKYGSDMEDWYWGNTHTLIIKHILSDLPIVGSLYTIGEVAAPGSKETLNSFGFKIRPAPFKVSAGPATRRVIDFSNPLDSYGIIPTGQSERALDDHFKDQFPLFLNTEYRLQKLHSKKLEDADLILLPTPILK